MQMITVTLSRTNVAGADYIVTIISAKIHRYNCFDRQPGCIATILCYDRSL